MQKLITRAEMGQAELAWIARKVAQKKLAPKMVDEITKARSGISWDKLKVYIEQPDQLQPEKFKRLGRKLQGLFGQLKTVEFLKTLDPGIVVRTEMKAMSQSVDVVAAVKKPIIIHQCQTFDMGKAVVITTAVKLSPPQGCAIECKAWKPASYRIPGNLDVLEQEVRQAKSGFSTVFVFVTSDFHKLPDATKTEVIWRITKSGGLLKVMPDFSSGSASYQAGRFIAFIG